MSLFPLLTKSQELPLPVNLSLTRRRSPVTFLEISLFHKDQEACHLSATSQTGQADLTFHLKDQTEFLLTLVPTPTFPSVPFPVLRAAKRHQGAPSANANARSTLKEEEEEVFLMEAAIRDTQQEDFLGLVVLEADTPTLVFPVTPTEAFPKVAEVTTIPRVDPRADPRADRRGLRDQAIHKGDPKGYRRAPTTPKEGHKDLGSLRKGHKGPTILKDKEYPLIHK